MTALPATKLAGYQRWRDKGDSRACRVLNDTGICVNGHLALTAKRLETGGFSGPEKLTEELGRLGNLREARIIHRCFDAFSCFLFETLVKVVC
jgi:hypothetical protein